jgi:hypothetical protein
MMTSQTIAIAQDVITGLILTVGFMLSLRTGRILPAVLFCWGTLTLQAFILSSAGARLAMAQDHLCYVFPEGPAFVASGLIGGWMTGLFVGGAGKLAHHLRTKRMKRREQNQTAEGTR